MKVMHEAHMRLLTVCRPTSYEAQTYGFDEAHMKLIDIALSFLQKYSGLARREHQRAMNAFATLHIIAMATISHCQAIHRESKDSLRNTQ
jgi:hypothetical protein